MHDPLAVQGSSWQGRRSRRSFHGTVPHHSDIIQGHPALTSAAGILIPELRTCAVGDQTRLRREGFSAGRRRARLRPKGEHYTVISDCGYGLTPALILRSSGSVIFYVLSLCLSKLSVACLLQRFSAVPKGLLVLRVLTAAVVCFGVIGLLVTGLRQELAKPWRYSVNTAESNWQRWLAVEVLGGVLEGIFLLPPMLLVWRLQMDQRTKITVILAFAFRAPVIALAVLRLVSIRYCQADNFSYTYSWAEFWPQLELHYSLVAATIPCLRIFLKGWNTSFLNLTLLQVDETAYAEHRASKGSYPLQTVNSSKAQSSSKRSSGRADGVNRITSAIVSEGGPWVWAGRRVESLSSVDGGPEGDAASYSS